jgi:hypothetical protein
MASHFADVTRLVVELDAEADPVTGGIGRSGEALEAFTGWTELAAAIERLRRRTGDDGTLSETSPP